MKAGDAVRWTFVQSDGQCKMRPAILIAAVPPFNDWLACALSSQVHREVAGLDIGIAATHPDFDRAGLSMPSLIRFAHLTTLPDKTIQGSVGEVSPATLALIKERLRKWLS